MIAAIGAFDGFHRGHRTLLEAAGTAAEVSGRGWGVITFCRQPGSVFARKGARFLFTNPEQHVLEKFYGIPTVHRIDFTEEIAGMSPAYFLDYIHDMYDVDGIVVGEDFRFGKDRAGDAGFLKEACEARGWVLDVIPIQKTDAGVPICSTTVRNALADGDMRYAWELLGYPYFCVSKVIHGNERGRRLGFPTANIEIPGDKVALKDGVYATVVHVNGGWHIGAANVGSNPTFNDVRGTRFEVNLVDYSGDLYGDSIAVFLSEWIRPEVRFDNADDLTRQVKSDTEQIIAIGERDLRDHEAMWRKFEKAL